MKFIRFIHGLLTDARGDPAVESLAGIVFLVASLVYVFSKESPDVGVLVVLVVTGAAGLGLNTITNAMQNRIDGKGR